MKKTLKKALILFAIVTVIVTVCAFAASAKNCGPGNHTIYEIYHAPTCTDPGYTEYRCTKCYEYKETSGSTEPALGHDHKGVDYVYEEVKDENNKVYYKRGLVCNRVECKKTIYDVHSEDGKAVYDRYYLVQLVNPYVADTYCAEITHADVVETYKELLVKTRLNDEYGNWYILEGESIESYIVNTLKHINYDDWMNTVNGTNIVRRLKDIAFGKYDLMGWAYSKLESGEVTEDKLVSFEDTIVDKNIKLYAAFKGDETVTYEVRYRDGNGVYLTTIFDVRHGKAARDDIFLPEYDSEGNLIKYNNDPLRKDEDIRAYYEFAGWSPSREAIYGSTDIIAQYKTIEKEYEFILYKWENGVAVPSGVTAVAKYGYPLIYKNADGEELTDAELAELTAREKDRSYIYSWDGGWKILDRDIYVNASSASVPYGTPDIKHKGEDGYQAVILVPTHNKRQVLYKSYVTIKFDNSVTFEGSTKEYDTETYLNGLNVQITDADGQLVTKGTAYLAPEADARGDRYAILECSVYDSSSYTVTVTSVRGKYSGSTTLLRTNVYDNNAPIQISVGLTVDENYINGQGCNCICHNSFFKPIWVRILNILYNLFNVKYVCCDDMYVSLGDLLAYTK